MRAGAHADVIEDAARQFEVRAEGTRALAGKYRVRGRVAIVDAGAGKVPFDKTDLLLAGQARAPVSMVLGSGMVTIAAPFGSGWDFVRMLALGGGMPTRVTVPESRFEEAVRLHQRRARSRGRRRRPARWTSDVDVALIAVQLELGPAAIDGAAPSPRGSTRPRPARSPGRPPRPTA